jgi:PadR family transcriptional regulator PadR
MARTISTILPGALRPDDVRRLEAMNSLLGFGIAEEIEKISGKTVWINERTIQASLVRLRQRKCCCRCPWGYSTNGRKPRFYSIPKRGQRRLAYGTRYWEPISNTIHRILSDPLNIH